MSMKMWGYYAFHTFINSIKKMFRSTVMIVIAAVFAVSLIFGFSIGIVGSVLEEELSGEESTEDITQREGYGDPEYGMFDENGVFLFFGDLCEEGLGGYDEDGNFIYYEDALEQGLGYYDENGDFIFYHDEMTEEEFAQFLLCIEAGAMAVILLMLFMGAYSGMKKGSDIFVMADVNFLFTAPMKPQSVLMFRLTFQMLATFAGCIYLIFQIPNLVINAGVPLDACLLIFLAIVFLVIYQKLFSVGMYTFTATHEKTRRLALPVIIGIVVLIAAAVGVLYLSNDRDVFKALELSLGADWSRWIPIVGWLKGMVMYAIEGRYVMVTLFSVLNLLGMVILVMLIWHMEADFYEDAMAGAQAREDLLAAAAENRKVVEVNADGKPKKDKRKVKDSQIGIFGKTKGAFVFYAKELVVRRRMAKFGIITNTMLWYFTITVGLALLFTKLMDLNEFAVIGFILMVVLFFRNYGNPIAQETSMNWLFLVPESPYKKVFFAMMAGTYASFMDLLPGFAVAMLIMELNPLVVLLWLVLLVTMDFMLSAVGMLLEALFPATAMDTVKASIQLILKFVVIIVQLIALVVGIFLGGLTAGLVAIVVVNILLGAVSFIIYPSMLHNGIA